MVGAPTTARPTPTAVVKNVFISYASADQDVANKLVAEIERRGIPCWISSRDIHPGEDYQRAIVTALETSGVVLLLFSQHANESAEIPKELALASKFRKTIIPARIEDIVPSGSFAYQITTAQFIDLFRGFEAKVEELCAYLAEVLQFSTEVRERIASQQKHRVIARKTTQLGAAALIIVLIGAAAWALGPKLKAISHGPAALSPVAVAPSAPQPVRKSTAAISAPSTPPRHAVQSPSALQPAAPPAQPASAAQTTSPCASQPFCYDASDFVATITDFRTTSQGGYKIIDVTVRFFNSTTTPLNLGFAPGSGLATDDHGNRYAIHDASGIRGMGMANGNSIDPKFVIRAGGFGDSRFELFFVPTGQQVVGLTFDLDLTVNEINSAGGNRYTLGNEFPLQFKGLTNGSKDTSVVANPVKPLAAPPAQPASAAQTTSPCASQPFCYDASDFVATITDFRTTSQGGYKIIDVTVRFFNSTTTPLNLGFAPGSGLATDDHGNRYAIHDASGVRGIGMANGNSIDPKFVIRAGGFGDSRFELFFVPTGQQVVGLTFELDLTVNEINSAGGNRYTLGNEFPLQFKGLTNGSKDTSVVANPVKPLAP